MEFLANKRANFYYSLFGPYYSNNIWSSKFNQILNRIPLFGGQLFESLNNLNYLFKIWKVFPYSRRLLHCSLCGCPTQIPFLIVQWKMLTNIFLNLCFHQWAQVWYCDKCVFILISGIQWQICKSEHTYFCVLLHLLEWAEPSIQKIFSRNFV